MTTYKDDMWNVKRGDRILFVTKTGLIWRRANKVSWPSGEVNVRYKGDNVWVNQRDIIELVSHAS